MTKIQEALKANLTPDGFIQYKGRKYRTLPLPLLCELNGAEYRCTVNRLYHGWSLEDAVEKASLNKTPSRDHTGQSFDSVKAMVEHWGITRDCYDSRLRMGWDIERALTTPVRRSEKNYCKIKMRKELLPALRYALRLVWEVRPEEAAEWQGEIERIYRQLDKMEGEA